MTGTHVPTAGFDCYVQEDYFGPPWTEPATVLLQHGSKRNGNHWHAWVPGLARDRVLRRDSRGHGRSTAGDRAHRWSPEAMAADVLAFLDARGLERVHYVGESTGGVTGVVLAATVPERLLTLTLVQTPYRLGRVTTLHLGGEFPDVPTAMRTLGVAGWGTRGHPVEGADEQERARVEWERAELDRCDLEAIIVFVEGMCDANVEDYLEQVRVPTLVLTGTPNPGIPLEDVFTMRRRIPGAQLELFEGHGADYFFGRDPERATDSVRRFIAGAFRTSPARPPR